MELGKYIFAFPYYALLLCIIQYCRICSLWFVHCYIDMYYIRNYYFYQISAFEIVTLHELALSKLLPYLESVEINHIRYYYHLWNNGIEIITTYGIWNSKLIIFEIIPSYHKTDVLLVFVMIERGKKSKGRGRWTKFAGEGLKYFAYFLPTFPKYSRVRV